MEQVTVVGAGLAGCGGHIHIGADYLTDLQDWKNFHRIERIRKTKRKRGNAYDSRFDNRIQKKSDRNR